VGSPAGEDGKQPLLFFQRQVALSHIVQPELLDLSRRVALDDAVVYSHREDSGQYFKLPVHRSGTPLLAVNRQRLSPLLLETFNQERRDLRECFLAEELLERLAVEFVIYGASLVEPRPRQVNILYEFDKRERVRLRVVLSVKDLISDPDFCGLGLRFRAGLRDYSPVSRPPDAEVVIPPLTDLSYSHDTSFPVIATDHARKLALIYMNFMRGS